VQTRRTAPDGVDSTPEGLSLNAIVPVTERLASEDDGNSPPSNPEFVRRPSPVRSATPAGFGPTGDRAGDRRVKRLRTRSRFASVVHERNRGVHKRHLTGIRSAPVEIAPVFRFVARSMILVLLRVVHDDVPR